MHTPCVDNQSGRVSVMEFNVITRAKINVHMDKVNHVLAMFLRWHKKQGNLVSQSNFYFEMTAFLDGIQVKETPNGYL